MRAIYRVILSPRAFADLDEILDYIQEDSPKNAIAVVGRILEAAHSLDELPYRFRGLKASRHVPGEIHVMPVSSYLIYYRIVEAQKVVQIITIRHGARRPPHDLN